MQSLHPAFVGHGRQKWASLCWLCVLRAASEASQSSGSLEVSAAAPALAVRCWQSYRL